jgi:hypothetical protein
LIGEFCGCSSGLDLCLQGFINWLRFIHIFVSTVAKVVVGEL